MQPSDTILEDEAELFVLKRISGEMIGRITEKSIVRRLFSKWFFWWVSTNWGLDFLYRLTPSMAMASKWTVTEQLLTLGHSALLCSNVLNLAPRIFDARCPMTNSRESITLLLPKNSNSSLFIQVNRNEIDLTASIWSDYTRKMLNKNESIIFKRVHRIWLTSSNWSSWTRPANDLKLLISIFVMTSRYFGVRRACICSGNGGNSSVSTSISEERFKII